MSPRATRNAIPDATSVSRGAPNGPEREADDERDRQNRPELDERQGILDLLELRKARRAGARDARVVTGSGAAGVLAGQVDLGGQADLGREEQVRDGRRPVLLRPREELRRVEDREREDDLVASLLLRGDVDRALHDRLLLAVGEAVRIAFDDRRVCRERDGEEALRARAGFDGRRVVRNQAPELERRAASEAGQVDGCRNRGGDPGCHDEVAQANDCGCEHARHGTVYAPTART